MTQPTCTVAGCDKPSRNKSSAAMCKMHYHRWYRHGSTDKVATEASVSVSLGRRYRTVSAPGHPMAMKSGKAYEHRVVLYDEIGMGPHQCHWCRRDIDWLPKGDPRELQVDHLNNDGADNQPDNLVPSCRDCNTTRGGQRRHGALREAGWWSNHDTVAALSAGGRRKRIEPAA